jgi:cytidine deaminase
MTGVSDVNAELFDAACQAQDHAYCRYSGYRVGVAIRTASGRVFAAANVENASYPLGTCAEAGAIAAMVTAGERQITDVVVVTDGATPGTPCGGCRQRLREFAAPGVVVRSTTRDRAAAVEMTIADLLPDSFGPEFLPNSS